MKINIMNGSDSNELFKLHILKLNKNGRLIPIIFSTIKLNKRGRNFIILDYYTVWTPSIAIDYVNTDFDHRLNELFSEFLRNFSCLEYYRFFSFETCLAFNKTCRMNIF